VVLNRSLGGMYRESMGGTNIEREAGGIA
jgi:hypothetical protein